MSETFAERPRDGVPRPLACERTRWPVGEETLWHEYLLGKTGLPRPWQQSLEHRSIADGCGELVIDRFAGVTISDLDRSATRHGRLLPLGAWLTLATEVLEVMEPLDPQRLSTGWTLSGDSVGWSLSGEPTMALGTLNGMLAGFGVRTGSSAVPPLAWLSVESVRGLPQTRASVAATGAHLMFHLLAGVPLMRREGAIATLQAIIENAPTPPSALHPEATPELDAAYARVTSPDVMQRWESPRALSLAIRELAAGMNVAPWPRGAAVDALFALTLGPLQGELARLREQAEWLPAEWERVYPRGAQPAEALSVFEDELLERLPDVSAFPRSKALPAFEPASPPEAPRASWFQRLRRRFGL